jgi:hypothetical protein
LQNVDDGFKVTNMKYRKLQINVSKVTNTLIKTFAACSTNGFFDTHTLQLIKFDYNEIRFQGRVIALNAISPFAGQVCRRAQGYEPHHDSTTFGRPLQHVPAAGFAVDSQFQS